MRRKRTLTEHWHDGLESFRLQVSRSDAIPALSVLGIVSGILAGAVIVAFRLLVEWVQTLYLGEGRAEHYEALSRYLRLAVPIGGGLLIGLLLQWVAEENRRVGVVHIMERLTYYQGRLPFINAMIQFVGGSIAIITGQSVGREGPSVHLGAASSNLPGQWLRLPHNSLRVLAACGTAGAIAASFNTPLAGVAFAMEVLLIEFTVAGLAPVILATVSATTLTRMVYGPELAFSVPALTLGSLSELPYILFMGVVIGALAAVFIGMLRLFFRLGQRLPIWLCTTLAGVIVGTCAWWMPQVMGIGYDTVDDALRGQLPVGLLVVLVIFKLVASTAAIGLRIPGGIIGPTLVVGAAAGGALGHLAEGLGWTQASSLGFHALVGMGAMMAASLQAPLAALTAILELTGNPNIIFPGMLAVIAATITSGYLGRHESVFIALMRAMGADYRNDPVTRELRRTGVAAAMNRSFVHLPAQVERERINSELQDNPRWVLTETENQETMVLPALDLARELEQHPDTVEFDLLALPAVRMQAQPIDIQASLQEAYERIESQGAEALFVTRVTVPGVPRVYGILTRENIENAYRLGH